jgi:23S rRNA pseudouridine2605 synthase
MTRPPRVGLARALSKLGFCSRRQGWALIEAGRVKVNGVVRTDPEWRVDLERARIEVDRGSIEAARKIYLMLNKPRGLVTTAADEMGRATVFDCLAGAALPFLSPVGRLDRASEGLILFTNDSSWAAAITDPASHVEKTYHVQVDCVADELLLAGLRLGVQHEGEWLAVKQAGLIRCGTVNSWIEIVLDEGKNRHIRRLLETLGIRVRRLIRVAIGGLPLGGLPKGAWRMLLPEEVAALSRRRSDPGERVVGATK